MYFMSFTLLLFYTMSYLWLDWMCSHRHACTNKVQIGGWLCMVVFECIWRVLTWLSLASFCACPFSALAGVGHLLFLSNNYSIFVSRLIEKTISSAYDTVRRAHLLSFGSSSGTSVDVINTENSSRHGSFVGLPKELFQMLACAGPYLYRDTLLLQKVQILYLIFMYLFFLFQILSPYNLRIDWFYLIFGVGM